MGQGNQAERQQSNKRQDSVFGSRAAVLVCLIAALAVAGAFSARAAFYSLPAWTDDRVDLAQKVADKEKDRPAGYIWAAGRGESALKLRGAVPSEEDRQTLLGMVKAHFPDLTVDDQLTVVNGGPPRDQWLGAVSFGLKQLSHLKRGSVQVFNVSLKVSGEARSAEDYLEIKKALAGPLPTGVTIKAEDVRPPLADPFVFTADLDINALSLDGSVPNEDLRKELRELSRQIFARPGLQDRLKLASGAPKGWNEAVTAALRALSRLERGRVALSGLAVTIEGVASDQGTAVAVSYQLRRDLPKLFSTSESIKWKEASAPRDVASQVLPRIKEYARTNGNWPKGELPPLMPLTDAQ